MVAGTTWFVSKTGMTEMTNSMICAGIDVSKDKLDIAIHPSGAHCVVDYTVEGFKKLDAFLIAHQAERVGFEASGGYEYRLLVHLRRGSLPAARFQPVQVKAFKRSKLQFAKNDQLDALAIAGFTAHVETLPPLPDVGLDGLTDHLTYIEQIEDRIVTLKTMRETAHLPRICKLHEADIARLQKRRLAEIALLIKQLALVPEAHHKLSLLTSIKGVGERTALAILVRLPEIGTVSREEAAALAGLAPYDDDSGKRKGMRHIHGGRQRLRKSLFMSAFSASQHNPDLKVFYNRLKERGKTHIHATVATARKLLVLANAVVRKQTPWQPERPTM
jgi:transposase